MLWNTTSGKYIFYEEKTKTCYDAKTQVLAATFNASDWIAAINNDTADGVIFTKSDTVS